MSDLPDEKLLSLGFNTFLGENHSARLKKDYRDLSLAAMRYIALNLPTPGDNRKYNRGKEKSHNEYWGLVVDVIGEYNKHLLDRNCPHQKKISYLMACTNLFSSYKDRYEDAASMEKQFYKYRKKIRESMPDIDKSATGDSMLSLISAMAKMEITDD